MTRATRWVLIAALVATAAPAGAETLFRFPGSDEHRPHFYITAYRDLSSSQLQDWACGSKTYGGHRGTDMGAGSFAGMDAGRDIVAAASGVVTFVHDGVFDRCTSGTCGGGGGFGNYVQIEHEDGKVTYYGHLKKHSITVAVGDEVSCGQVVGQMGSSGNSTGPHLHFEPRVNNNSDDPFSGPCGGPESWWVQQGEYQALPEPVCQDGEPSHPALAMDAEIDADALDVGGEAVARFYVMAGETGEIARDIVVAIEAPGDSATILDWQVFDDFEGNECGGAMCPNDANDHPDNPPRELPGRAFDLHLYSLSPGETKMIELVVRADAPAAGAPLRAWVKDVPGTYQKPSFDGEPQNVDGSQTFNGGDLKRELRLDIESSGGGGGGGDDGDPGTPDDPENPADPADGGVAGGCIAAAGSAPGLAHALLVLAAAAAVRRTRREPATRS